MPSALDGVEAAPQVQYMIFQRIERPKKMFFYERVKQQTFGEDMQEVTIGDGPKDTIFACSEQEAAGLHRPPHQGKFKQVGVSDGSAYYKSLQNCGVQMGDRIPVERGRKILKDAFQAELEVARGHYQEPRRVFVHTPDGTVPNQIIATFKP